MAQALTGSKASVKLNGEKIAFASGVNINIENTLTDVDVLDQLEVAELAETGHKVDFSVNFIKVVENSAANLGLDPENIDALLAQPELTFEVFNRDQNRVEFEIQRVKYAGGSTSGESRGLFTGTYNFRGVIGRNL